MDGERHFWRNSDSRFVGVEFKLRGYDADDTTLSVLSLSSIGTAL